MGIYGDKCPGEIEADRAAGGPEFNDEDVELMCLHCDRKWTVQAESIITADDGIYWQHDKDDRDCTCGSTEVEVIENPRANGREIYEWLG